MARRWRGESFCMDSHSWRWNSEFSTCPSTGSASFAKPSHHASSGSKPAGSRRADLRAVFNAATDYEKANKFDKAAEAYELLVASYLYSDKSKDAMFNLGLCYEKLGKLDKSLYDELVRIPGAFRATHMYIVGASGAGKSSLMKNLIIQDIS